MTVVTKQYLRMRRKNRIRSKILGTDLVPRMTVFKSHKSLYVQVIDDTKGHTLASAKEVNSNIESAQKLGSKIATVLKGLSVKSFVFDRNGYKFHGVVKNLADTAFSSFSA